MDLFWRKARKQKELDLILLRRIKDRSMDERSNLLPKRLSSHAKEFHRHWKYFLDSLEEEEDGWCVPDNLFVIPSHEVPKGTESYKVFLDDLDGVDFWKNGGKPPKFNREIKRRSLNGKSYVGPNGFKSYLSRTHFKGHLFEDALSTSLSNLGINDSLEILSDWRNYWIEAGLTLIERTPLDEVSEDLARPLINRINKAQTEINKLELKLKGCGYIIKEIARIFPTFKSLEEGYKSFQSTEPRVRSTDYETFLMPVLSMGPLTNLSS